MKQVCPLYRVQFNAVEQYTYDRQTDRQNKSVLFCCQNNFYVEQTGALRPRLFRGRDAPFSIATKSFQRRISYETTK